LRGGAGRKEERSRKKKVRLSGWSIPENWKRRAAWADVMTNALQKAPDWRLGADEKLQDKGQPRGV